MKCGWSLGLLVALFTVQCYSQLQIISTETNQALNHSSITVGSASDLALQVQCRSTDSTGEWSSVQQNIAQGLTPFGFSQENGVLRVFPVTLLNSGVNEFSCSDGSETLTVVFDLRPDLFFTSPVPESAPMGTDVTTLCSVPDIPFRNVTAVDVNGFSYCQVSTQRGSFRSRSIINQEAPSFTYEPVDIIARPFDTSSRAAFSCAVQGGPRLVSIDWLYSMAMFSAGSSMGMGPAPTDGILTSGMDGVTIFSGMAVSETRTSVLLLEDVGSDHEGFYMCVATFEDGAVLRSTNATLTFDSTPSVGETIILSPPESLTFLTSANRLLLPCVSSGLTTPSFNRPTGTTTSVGPPQFGLEAETAASGTYTCSLGDIITRQTMVTNTQVTPRFTQPVPRENLAPSPAMSEQSNLRCFAFGGLAVLLRDQVVLASGPTIASPPTTIIASEATDGFYQCGSAPLGGDPQNLFIPTDTTSYLLLAFVRNPAITGDLIVVRPPTGQLSTTLTCTAEGNPLPQITWAVGGAPRPGVQEVTGFMTPASSTMTLDGLPLGDSVVTCTATLMNITGVVPDSTSVTVQVQAAPVILSPPTDLTVTAPAPATLSCSVEGFPLPDITWAVSINNGPLLSLTGERVTITAEPSSGSVVTSSLALSPTLLTDNGVYFCTGSNSLGSVNASATLTVYTAPEFLVDPVPEVVAVNNDSVSLSCTVQGNSIPSINWMVLSNDTLSAVDGEFLVTPTVQQDDFSLTSVLNFTAALKSGLRGNGSIFFCVANNSVSSGVESNRTQLIIAGPPLAVEVTVSSITSRGAMLSWKAPFSLVPLTAYGLSLSPPPALGQPPASLPANTLVFNFTSLAPATEYSVSVGASNRAGTGPVTVVNFTTLEDVPDGFPVTVDTSSTLLGLISVSWSQVLTNASNGVIVGYTVQYQTNGESQFKNITRTSTMLSVTAGLVYNISVAARTVVGAGPYSFPAVVQATISDLPTLPPEPLPSAAPPTTTTITIPLPRFPGQDSISHYWVVVIRVDITGSSLDLSVNPAIPFPDDSSFRPFSETLPLDTPYIAAEIGAENYSLANSFVIGEESGINDFPMRYQNGPLAEGAMYTAFIRAFANSVPDGVRVRRQIADRQYSVFVSSPFVDRQSTPLPGPAVGVVAGIVVALVLLLVVVVLVVVIAVVLYGRSKYSTGDYSLPHPPSRKGSVRIRDQREIIPNMISLKAETSLPPLNPEDQRVPILVEDFPAYVRSMHANTDHLFSEEYEILGIKSPSLPHVHCSLPYNVAKNRYANINCYDDTRAKLEPIPGIDGSDYINANYIDGYLEKRGFIAAQGPLAQTTQDFWRLVWEQNSCCIIMLTNVVEKNRAKCHQYWPEVGSVSLGELSVTLIEIQQLAYYTVRTFRMSRGNDRREVKQFHYTGWPDFGVPDYPHPVMAFLKRINNFKRSTPGPFVIHCSAGVGRTGTLLTIQAMMQMMEEEGKIDVFNFVLGLRHQRNYMVQTERQYIFIHDCVVEILKTGETTIPIQVLRRRYKELLAHDPHLDSSRMEAEYARLTELELVEDAQFEPARLPVNQPKNRYQHILPYDRFRVRLLLHPGVSGSDFINASYIDGYQHRHQYIVTQGPMKHTVTDFWRLIWEHRVSCVLMLCPLEEKGKEQSVRYWPTEKIIQQGDMFIELTQMTDYGSYTMREFSVTNTKINESRVIKHYQYPDWLEETMPANAAAVIDLIGVLQKTQHMLGGGPIVVHDSTSVGRSATFCVLSSVLEQLKVEGTVDLFAVIHSLRHQQPGIVNSFALYKFCYQAVIEFLDSFDHYANFD